MAADLVSAVGAAVEAVEAVAAVAGAMSLFTKQSGLCAVQSAF